MTENLNSPTDTNSQPTNHLITLQQKVDIQRMHDAGGQRLHSMTGFDPKFSDIVDYIIRVTHEIWEEKAIGKLYDYYANAIHLHTTTETIHGRDAVLAASIGTMAAYPDRRLLGDEVVWGGDDVQGFYTSHRLTHIGTNKGWSLYGPPTGNRIQYQAIADCHVKQNMIVEEWLVRDELTLVHQLGLDPVETARKMARKDVDRGVRFPIASDINRGVGQYPPRPIAPTSEGPFDPEHFIRNMYDEVWNWRMLNKVRDYYSPTVPAQSASLRKMHGHDDYQGYILSILSPFPTLAISMEHFCHVGDEETGYRTATRWRMRGVHTGYGIYGEPTGHPIEVMGVSHHLIKDGVIQAEWTLFDEFALLKQLHQPK